jgi:predicted nucleotide-binding protein
MPYYYISIRYLSRTNSLKREGSFGLTENEVRDRYAEPFVKGEEIFIGGKRIANNMIDAIQVFETEKPISKIAKEYSLSKKSVCTRIRLGKIGKNVTNRFINKIPLVKKISSTKSPNDRIFIIHGRAVQPKNDLADFLTDCGLEPVILAEEPNRGRTIIEKLELSNVGYAFAILTPDDEGCLCGTIDKLLEEKDKEVKMGNLKISNGEVEKTKRDIRFRARQNVILELGYFIGKLGRHNVCYLHQGNLDTPSDILGLGYLEFKDSIADCYEGIITELKAAGYRISL